MASLQDVIDLIWESEDLRDGYYLSYPGLLMMKHLELSAQKVIKPVRTRVVPRLRKWYDIEIYLFHYSVQSLISVPLLVAPKFH